MGKFRLVLILCTFFFGVIGCSGPTTKFPGPGEADAEQAVEQASAIGDWSMEGGAKVAPMAMDMVMASVDERLATAGQSRMRSPYSRKGVAEVADHSDAPYFHVASDDPSVESLPLKSTSAKVDIAGVIAQVLVTQVYQNRGATPIEAVYVFPGSTHSAVHGMRMTIGKRTIVAKIEERGKARADYETAKQQGKRASLLEQQRPNVFTMNVANIMPGDIIKTELLYSELLVPEDGHYDFVYPTVVGPRNPMGSEPGTVSWNANPYLGEGQKEPYQFDIKVHLASPIGLKAVTSPSHQIDVAYASAKSANISLKQAGGGNRDYVLRYRLAGDQIESGAMLYDHGGEKFFLMMMEPPKRVQPQQIPGREYIFVLDVSGSMNGFPLDTAKVLMTNLFQRMRPNDYFNVVVFAGRAGVLSPQSLPATQANLRQAIKSFKRMRGGGGTNLMDALRTSYALPTPEDGAMSRSVVVVTDGYVTVEAQAFRFIRKRLGEANLFSFGIGSSVNRALIEGMSRAGMGSPFVVLDKTQAADKAAKLRKYIESPLLTNIKVSFQGVDVYDAVPEAMPDLMAARPLILFGKYRGSGKGSIRVVGAQGTGMFQRAMELDPATAQVGNRPLRALWARNWVEQLMDQYNAIGGDEDIKNAVINLGLGYSLLTQFTSFIAIDSRVANTTGQISSVKQPLPLPKGVSNLAVPSQRMGGRSVSAEAAMPSMSAGGAGVAGGSMRRAPARPASPARRPSPAPRAKSSQADSRSWGLSADSAGDDESESPGGVAVTKITNFDRRHQVRLRRLVLRLFGKCAAGFKGKLIVRLHANGTIATEGGNVALRTCMQRHRVIDQLMTALQKQPVLDPKRPATIEVTFQ